MENIPKVSIETKGPKAGELRSEDFGFSGGMKEEQLEFADSLLSSTLPHVEKPETFGSVDTTRATFGAEDMFEIPEAGEHKVPGDLEHEAPAATIVVQEEKKQSDQKVLDTLLIKQLEAKVSGDSEEATRIGKMIDLQRSRMSSK